MYQLPPEGETDAQLADIAEEEEETVQYYGDWHKAGKGGVGNNNHGGGKARLQRRKPCLGLSRF